MSSHATETQGTRQSCSPLADTNIPQTQVCGSHMLAPKRNPTATLRASSLSLMPQEGIIIIFSLSFFPSAVPTIRLSQDSSRLPVCLFFGRFPRQQKFRAMNGAHLASPIRGELGYAHWPQLGTQFIALLGTKFGAH